MNHYAEQIAELIRGTNNGKLLVDRIPYPLRDEVAGLLNTGYLVRATFMHPGDAVAMGCTPEHPADRFNREYYIAPWAFDGE